MEHDQADRAHAILEPHVRAAIEHMATARFSTKRLIDEIRSTLEGEAAYQAALALCEGHGVPTHTSYLVVHGQTIPGLLRGSGLVRFAGFIHGDPDQEDGYHVPGWWRRV